LPILIWLLLALFSPESWTAWHWLPRGGPSEPWGVPAAFSYRVRYRSYEQLVGACVATVVEEIVFVLVLLRLFLGAASRRYFTPAALLAALLLGGCAHHLAPAESPLIGTWRLVEYWNQPKGDAVKRYPYGEQPLGYIVYDCTGHVFVQFARNPLLARLSSEQLRTAGADDLRATVDGYVAYFGTYTVDAARGVVVHHVIADVRREYTGTDQERPFRVSGEELLVGDGKTWLRRFTRAPDVR
jgi:hypothetical protein